MAPAITVNPNPTAPGVMCRVLGTGFDKRVFVSIVFDGVGSTTKFKPNGQGKFDVGLDVVSTKPDGTYAVQARKHGTTTVLATTNLVVKKVIVVPPPVDPVPTVTSGPTITNLTQTSASVTWTVSENATGKINYGTSTAYGSTTPEEVSFNYATHTQGISGLVADTTYYIQVVGKDTAGQGYSKAASFKTLATVVVPPPVDPPPTGTTHLVPGVYGPGVGMDTRSNLPIGPYGQKASYRFIASHSSKPAIVRLNVRGGTGGYSLGNGGILKVAIQEDASGLPSGTDIIATQWSPGNASGGWEDMGPHNFGAGPNLVAGKRYHMVFTNPAADSTANFISINAIWANNAGLQYPAFTDDFATYLYDSSWHRRGELPVFDLEYANGGHDGQIYFGLTGIFSEIQGSKMVRERFTVSDSDRQINKAGFRVSRQSGTGDLTIRLEDSAGNVLRSGTVSASNWTATNRPLNADTDANLYGCKWGVITFSNFTLVKGQTYNLRASAPAGTIYWMHDMHEVQTFDTYTPEWGSRGFHDGEGQRTEDGATWTKIYEWAPQDAECFMGFDGTTPPPPTGGTYPVPRRLSAVPLNSDPKPAVNQVITDSVAGTKIRRISGDGHQNQYSKHQAWSKDGSRIFLQFGWLVDGNTFADLGQLATGTEYPCWSNIEPATMYGFSDNQNAVKRWTQPTGWQTIATLTGYNHLSLGNYEGTISSNDRVSLIGRKTDGSWWLLVYDLANKRLVAEGRYAEPNGSHISQSGKYVIANYNGHAVGQAGQGSWLYNADTMQPIRQLSSGQWAGYPFGHQDFGWAKDGAEVIVFVEPGGGGTMAQRLDNGTEYFISKGIHGVGHVSCANYERPGYAYLSSNSYYTGAYGVNQGIAVPIAPMTMDPPMGEVFACLHAENPATHQQYNYAPHVSANRNGSKIIWGSVWSNTSTGPMSAYIAGA